MELVTIELKIRALIKDPKGACECGCHARFVAARVESAGAPAEGEQHPAHEPLFNLCREFQSIDYGKSFEEKTASERLKYLMRAVVWDEIVNGSTDTAEFQFNEWTADHLFCLKRSRLLFFSAPRNKNLWSRHSERDVLVVFVGKK